MLCLLRAGKNKFQSWERVQRSAATEHRAETAPQAKIFRSTKCRARGARQPCISHAGIRHPRWWPTLSRNAHVGREVWPAPTASMFTDASMRVLGAVWNGKVQVSGFFDTHNEGPSINELGLLADIHGLRGFSSSHVRGK
jgi:hypothetical protein